MKKQKPQTTVDGLSYADLLREFQPRPIATIAESLRRQRQIDVLLKKKILSHAEQDLLELITLLVEQYEAMEVLPPVSPAAMLEHLLEERNMTSYQFAKAVGIARSAVTDILSGRRRVSLANVCRFAKYFHVSADLFLDKEPTK